MSRKSNSKFSPLGGARGGRGSIFFQHPMGLWGAEPYRLLADDMGPVGKGIYWDVFEQIRLGNGIDSMEHLLTMYDGVRNRMQRESLRKKLNQVINDYGLFNVNAQGMVTIIDHARGVRDRNRVMLQEPDLFGSLSPDPSP